MSNIKIDIVDNGITTLATAGKYCDRNVDIAVNVPSSGGGSIEVEPIVLSGSGSYACAKDICGNYINLFGDTITTKDIYDASNMFYYTTAKSIPFEINFVTYSYASMSYMFGGAKNLKQIPKMNNVYPGNMSNLFNACENLRELPEDFGADWNMSRMNSYTSANFGNIFSYCSSLRKIPKSFLDILGEGQATNSFNVVYKNFVYYCYSLDEINSMPVLTIPTLTSNVLSDMLIYCFRLKDFTFAVNEDGTNKIVKWAKQVLDLSQQCGYTNSYTTSYITSYNSGITKDKEVKDDATYQALKNNPDWYTGNIDYSRYNKTSAVNTINSLPDTSVYLATAGGTNTIKFKGAAGALTDGGAINTLTEEEIAVATAKGWTVSMV